MREAEHAGTHPKPFASTPQSDMSHDTGSEPKTEELGSQNPQNATQDIIVTLQVPAALQQLQQQLLSDQAFPIPQIQLLQQLATGQDQGGAPQQVRHDMWS